MNKKHIFCSLSLDGRYFADTIEFLDILINQAPTWEEHLLGEYDERAMRDLRMEHQEKYLKLVPEHAFFETDPTTWEPIFLGADLQNHEVVAFEQQYLYQREEGYHACWSLTLHRVVELEGDQVERAFFEWLSTMQEETRETTFLGSTREPGGVPIIYSYLRRPHAKESIVYSKSVV